MTVNTVHFKGNDLWYVQIDGLAMGASLAVNLANLWLKDYEFALSQETPVETEIQPMNDKNSYAQVAAGNSLVDQRRLNARVAETGIN